MPPSVFRFSRSYRLAFLFSSLLLLGLAIWLQVAFFPPGWPPSGIAWVLEGAVLLPFLVSLLLGYQTVFCWTYRLELDERGMRTRHIAHPWLRRLQCSYDGVAQVRRVGTGGGVLEVVPRAGRPVRIISAGLAGGEKPLLAEMGRHIDSSRLPADLPISPQVRRFSRLMLASYVVLLIALLGLLYLEVGHPFLLSQIGWHPAGRQYALSSDIKALALDADGNPWFVEQPGVSSRYQVQHVTRTGTQVWAMPPEAANWGEVGRPLAVAWDEAGQPIVVCAKRLFHWTDAAWQMAPFPPAELGKWVSEIGIATWGAMLWSRAYSSGDTSVQLLEMGLSAGTWRLVPLPEAAAEEGLSVSGLSLQGDGSLLVLLGREEFYLYQGGRWQRLGDPAQTQFPAPVRDLTLDSHGQLWVLTFPTDLPQSLGRLDRATSTWQWGELQAPPGGEFTALQVDARGRVWLAGRGNAEESWREYMQVVEFVPGAAPRPIVQYTPDNSGYQQGSYFAHELRLGRDGRLWAADRRLVWIDTTAENLSRPLPRWVEQISNQRARLFWMVGLLMVEVVFIALYIVQRLARKAK